MQRVNNILTRRLSEFIFKQNVKVHIFWEGPIILRNLEIVPLAKFQPYFCPIDSFISEQSICIVPVKSKVEISQNFVGFSEYMNFKTAHAASATCFTNQND